VLTDLKAARAPGSASSLRVRKRSSKRGNEAKIGLDSSGDKLVDEYNTRQINASNKKKQQYLQL